MKLGKANFPGGRLLGGAAAASAALPVLHELIPHEGLHGGVDAGSGAEPHMHGNGLDGGAPRCARRAPRRGRHRRPARERVRPPGDPARLRRGPGGERRARVGARRRGEGDRGGARREVRGLGVQRARAGADAAGARGRAAADPLHERLEAPAHDPLPRHPPARRMDGVPGVGRGQHRARQVDHLRVRRHALRAAPLPLPHDAACRAHREGALRRVHHRPEGGRARRPTSS